MIYNFEPGPVATEILPTLFLGNWEDALLALKKPPKRGKQWKCRDTLCVIETASWGLPKRTTHYIPILKHDDEEIEHRIHFIPYLPPTALRAQLDKCSDLIEEYVTKEKDLLVHCYEGRERSPLTLAYWLVKTGRKKDLDEAYDFLKALRPIISDRRNWIEMDEE